MEILPSDHEPGGELVLAPFRGLRYARDRVTGLAQVTSPPYDVIAHEAAERLLASDPHNVVRLILPRHDPGSRGDAYRDAARRLRQWQDQGILAADPRPALYVYEQRSHGSGKRPGVLQRGLIGALRLSPPESGPVLAHEDVMPGPVAGRRRLMEATQANLEPIFLLYDGDGGAATALVTETATERTPLLSVDTDDGLRHRLWAVTDPAEHAAVAADLAARQALIADGHHRHAAYREVQARRRAAGDGAGPWDFGLAMLVDSAAYPPQLSAIHRVVHGLAAGEAARRAAAAFTVRAVPPQDPARSGGQDLAAGQAALEHATEDGGVAFLIVGGGQAYLLTDPDMDQMAAAAPGRSARWRALPSAILRELLLGRAWGIEDTEHGVEAHHDPAEAVRAASGPRAATAVMCPPPSADAVQDLAAGGERVPRKSTSFGPKPRTGLVMRSFDHG